MEGGNAGGQRWCESWSRHCNKSKKMSMHDFRDIIVPDADGEEQAQRERKRAGEEGSDIDGDGARERT